MLKHLGVELPLGVVGLGAELPPNICSGYRLRLEEPHAHWQGGGSCIPGSQRVPITPTVEAEVMASSPVILAMFEHLGVLCCVTGRRARAHGLPGFVF